MKVIHLISGGDTGGAKTHVHMLLHNLSKTIDVTMVCFTDGSFAQEARALGIRTVIFAGKNIVQIHHQLKRFILEEGFELIHCHGARGNMMGAFLRRSTGLPVVTTVHSDYRLDYLGRPLARLTFGTINSIAVRRLDYRIGVSDAMTDLLISRGFDPNRLFTIYNGIDFTPRVPAMNREEYLKSLNLDWPQDSVIVGITARLNPVKDIPTLIRGFALAHDRYPKLRLLIAGDGEELPRLKALCTQLGVTKEVCFAGWITDTDSFYNAIDINSLTSLSETFSYSLTEGARFHLPTVASRVGGVPYLIDHGIHGLLFEAGDYETLAAHLSALCADPELRKHLGERLFQRAKADYSLESTLERQLDIYRSILRRETRKANRRDGVLICGAYGKNNAGDDAILEAVIQEMRQLDPDLPLWVLSRKPKETRLTYRVGAIYTFRFLKWLPRMAKLRLYVNGGGSLMQDATSHRSLWYYLFTIWIAKTLKNPVIMYGCGIGPIHSHFNRRLCAKIIQKCVDIITLRDPNSKMELESMEITHPRIVLAADPTVTLAAADSGAVDGLLESAGLKPDGKYIGFTVRPWSGFDRAVEVFAQTADYAYQAYGLTPVFLPIEPRLDVGAAKQIVQHMKAPYYLLDKQYSPANALGLFSRMQVVVSMRLHALIFSASQGVPLVGVVYDPKVSSFLEYIGQDLYTDLDKVTFETMKRQVDAAVARVGDTTFLSNGVDRLRTIERRNQECAGELLGLGGGSTN